MTHPTSRQDAANRGFSNKEVSDYEVTAVYRHPEATADIVLVHGLKGHPKKTWRSKNDVFWPTDLLPAALENEKANVLVYGYNADVYTSNNAKSPSDNHIFQHARSLVTSLTQFRRSEKTVELPIIWVVHSFGGIVVKKALLFSQELHLAEQQHYRSLYVSTYAIIFLGTPHNGSDIAKWGHVVEKAINIAVPQKLFATESRLLKSLKKDNGELQDINRQFSNICGRFKMHMVHENHKTDIKTTKQMIVDSESACPQLPGVVYYGIEATHGGMCKFDNVNAPGFRNISTAIRDWVQEASPVVSQRWIGEHESRRNTARNEIDERMISLVITYTFI
ncbi:unnamed protein product [Clonostachys rosea]|uniref:DUF676 domain-containing protein n=1 Tax=Bionectria ochroleuca TaxID=29856 RepID=A0ABY6U6B8_BIOOC|nr:unnamed protein product [Clonostachys rosea]